MKRTGQSANKGDSGSSLIQQIRAATDSRELERTQLLQRCLLLRPVSNYSKKKQIYKCLKPLIFLRTSFEAQYYILGEAVADNIHMTMLDF